MTLTLTRRGRALLAGLATTAFVAGAGAGSAQAAGGLGNPNDPALNVPADKIEHVVREVTTTGVAGRHTLDELYLGSDKAHWISRDLAGRIVRESTYNN